MSEILSNEMLPSAFALLNNPSLLDFWTITYPAAPGAIVEISIFMIFAIDFASTRYIGG